MRFKNSAVGSNNSTIGSNRRLAARIIRTTLCADIFGGNAGD
ncbi:MAG TPA: hypothetical protein VF656_02430 [Pyrinomonadaceae bacterium]